MAPKLKSWIGTHNDVLRGGAPTEGEDKTNAIGVIDWLSILGGEALTDSENETNAIGVIYRLIDDVLAGAALTESENNNWSIDSLTMFVEEGLVRTKRTQLEYGLVDNVVGGGRKGSN